MSEQVRRGALFPAVVVVAFVVVVALGWNQSSSGVVRDYVEGERPDPAQLYGRPNPVRFDEWMVTTSFIVSQDTLDYPQVNHRALGGTDVSITSALPYRDWSTAFRPSSWGFLVLPFDQAFAFFWWLPVLLLVLGTYALLLVLRPGRPGFAAAGALVLLWAPFVQWWLLTGTLGCLAWATIILAAFIALGGPAGANRWRRAGLLALIAFSTTAFLLLLYPPFQVACGWIVVAVMIGWTWRAGAPAVPLRDRLRPLAWTLGAGAAGVAVFGLFLATRWSTVDAQLHTEYPGNRVVHSGQDNLTRFFSGFLAARFPAGEGLIPPALGGNASEASSFVVVGVFLALPALWLLRRGRRTDGTVDGLLVALLAVLVLFLGFLFVPGIDLLARLTGLASMDPERLYIGLGLWSLLMVAALLRERDRQSVRFPGGLVAATGLLAVTAYVATAVRIHELSPQLTGGVATWLPLALVPVVVVVLAVRGSGTGGLAVLAAFSLLATFRVHPLRDGIYDVRSTSLGRAVTAIDRDEPGRWVALGSIRLEAVLAQLPIERRSGIALHPVPEMWETLDPTGAYREVTNRYALIKFTDDSMAEPLVATDVDDIRVRLDPCGRFAQRDLDYVLADHEVTLPCLEELDRLDLGGAELRIYAIT